MIFQNSIYDGATYTATSEFRNTQVKSTASYTHQRQHLDPYLTRGDSNYMWGEICTSRTSHHVTCQHMELRKITANCNIPNWKINTKLPNERTANLLETTAITHQKSGLDTIKRKMKFWSYITTSSIWSFQLQVSPECSFTSPTILTFTAMH